MSSPDGIKQIKPHFYFGSALVISMLMWLWWLIDNFTNLRVVRKYMSTDGEPVSYWVALIATVIFFVGALWFWRRAAGVVANGVLVDAKILSFGSSRDQMQDATLYHEVEGKFYMIRKSLYLSDLGDATPGDYIPIVADKRNPKRIIVNT